MSCAGGLSLWTQVQNGSRSCAEANYFLAHHFTVDVQPFDEADGSSGLPPETNYGQLEVHEIVFHHLLGNE